MNTPDPLERLQALLKNIGDPGTCRGCQAPIHWVRHKNGKVVPYTTDGLNHFIDCPAAKNFKKAAG